MKKRYLSTIILFLLAAAFAFSLAACDCGAGTVQSLRSDQGITIEGGGFRDGTVLVSKKIEATAEEAKAVLAAIADQDYNKEGAVHIFDIHTLKDGDRVQPNGRIRVSVPVPDAEIDDYLVFHVKDDSSVEALSPTVADGRITFEVSSFSFFVFAERRISLGPCAHVYGEYVRVDTVTCLEFGRIARQCTLCGHVDESTAPGSHAYGELTPGKEPTYYTEGAAAYYSCAFCRGIFNEAREPITTTVIPKLTPEYTLYLNGAPAGAFAVSNATSSQVTLVLDGVSVTKGQTVEIRSKDGSEACEYTVKGTDMDSAGILWGNVDPEAKAIRSTSTSKFTLVLNNGAEATLAADGYVDSGVVIEITSIDTGRKPVYFPMTRVDSLEGSEKEAYVFGLLGSDSTTSFRIIDLDNDKVYDYDDISESVSWDSWSYSRGENGEIQFSSNLTDWWVAFDIDGDGRITLRRFNLPRTGTPEIVFKSGDTQPMEKNALAEGSDEYSRYVWPLINGVFSRTSYWDGALDSGVSVYRATISIDSPTLFYIGIDTLKHGGDHLAEVEVASGAIGVSGNYIELKHSGKYVIEYLPIGGLINIYQTEDVHCYEAVVTPPTCTEDGYTTYTCGCGDSYVDDEVDATGHTYVGGVCDCGETDPGYVPEGDSKIINRIDVLGVTMPYTGEKPATDDEPYVLQEGLELLSVEWVKEDWDNWGEYLPFGPEDTFEYENSFYIVKVRLKIQEGYQFDYDPEYGYYRGMATVNYVRCMEGLVYGDVIEYYTYLGCNDTTIYYAGLVSTSDAIFETCVIPGAHPAFDFITVYDGFHISEIRWIDSDEGDGTPGSGKLLTPDDVFVEDHSYEVEIYIEVDEGYSFHVDVYGVWMSVFINEMETGAQTIYGVNGNEKLVVTFGYYCMSPEKW